MRQLKVSMSSDDRVETGGVRINDDWPGFYLRGDDALYVASLISSLSTTHTMGVDNLGRVHALKIYADQIFNEVPFDQWIDTRGRSIIMARKSPGGGKRMSIELSEEANVGILPITVWPYGGVSMGTEEEDDAEEGEG